MNKKNKLLSASLNNPRQTEKKVALYLSKLLKNKSNFINQQVRFKSMINGSYFGEVDIIYDRKRKYVAACETACELFYITRFEYETIIVKEFPHSII